MISMHCLARITSTEGLFYTYFRQIIAQRSNFLRQLLRMKDSSLDFEQLRIEAFPSIFRSFRFPCIASFPLKWFFRIVITFFGIFLRIFFSFSLKLQLELSDTSSAFTRLLTDTRLFINQSVENYKNKQQGNAQSPQESRAASELCKRILE